uniref:Tripartite motif-containing protein 14-like isoform X2 n=1 Tax=Petromyzon marinus TaxID=7757 RepID=A0AAJ7TLJ6_PETMA|nr:tripartite motif-containing protein 14-like isoform X2 [Petromyzon marinus]
MFVCQGALQKSFVSLHCEAHLCDRGMECAPQLALQPSSTGVTRMEHSSESGSPCSICENVSTNAIRLDCNHNFCSQCTKGICTTDAAGAGSSSSSSSCPLCQGDARAPRRVAPEEGIVHAVAAAGLDDRPGGSGHDAAGCPAPDAGSLPSCDFCLVSKLPAAKTCLTCLASYCEMHVRPHLRSPPFRGHNLTEPVRDLSAIRCPEHGKALELFCRDDGVSVCGLCPLLGRHKQHRVVTVEQELLDKKKSLQTKLTFLDETSHRKEESISQLKEITTGINVSCEGFHGKLLVQFQGLQRVLEDYERCTMKAVDMEKQITQLRVDKEIKKLTAQNAEISELRNRMLNALASINIWNLASIEDFSDAMPPEAEDLEVQRFSLESVKLQKILEAVDHLEAFCGDHVSHPSHGQRHPSSREPQASSAQEVPECAQASSRKPARTMRHGHGARPTRVVVGRAHSTGDCEPPAAAAAAATTNRQRYLQFITEVKLNPRTAHPNLTVTPDNKMASCGRFRWFCDRAAERFESVMQVLCAQGFFSGRHYWEVDVRGAGRGWWVGAAYGSMSRKGSDDACSLGRNKMSWCLKRFDVEYWCFHDNQRVPLVIDEEPQRVGVFLDFEEGILSFHIVFPQMIPLYSFKTKFTDVVYPAFRLWEGSVKLPVSL